MKDLFILKILDLFKFIYIKIGVNYDLMRLILKNKLIIDNRKDDNKNTFYVSLGIYLVIGLISSIILRINISSFEKMTIYFTFLMIIMLNSLIIDFSSVIISIRDKEILEPFGIDNKTLNASKLTHVLIYMTCVSLSINIFPFIVSLRYGIEFFIILFINVSLINMFILLITMMIYLTILTLFKGERLKKILNLFQILFIATFTIISQLIAININIDEVIFDFRTGILSIFYPPMWFASNFIKFDNIKLSYMIIILNLLSIVVPIISIIVYIKSMKTFENKLSRLLDNSYKSRNKKNVVVEIISNIICKNKEEKVFFNFINSIIKSEKELKSRIYPTIIMSTTLPIIILYMMSQVGMVNNIVVFSMYLSMILLISSVSMLKYSSEYEGSFIYEILPIKNKKNISKAMFKFGVYKFVMPIFTLISIIYIYIFKLDIVIDIFIILINTLIASLFIFKVSEDEYPFSKEFLMMSTFSNIKPMIISLVCIIFMATIHIAIYIYFSKYIYIYLFVSIIYIYRVYKKTFCK